MRKSYPPINKKVMTKNRFSLPKRIRFLLQAGYGFLEYKPYDIESEYVRKSGGKMFLLKENMETRKIQNIVSV